jgi:hypothetical protein
MRKAAGIILIAFGAYFLWILIDVLVVVGSGLVLAPVVSATQGLIRAVILIGLIIPVAFSITGGIFGLRRKYWRVCLASASFVVLLSVFDSTRALLSWEILILRSWVNWVMVVVAVIAVIFICLRRKEWREILA